MKLLRLFTVVAVVAGALSVAATPTFAQSAKPQNIDFGDVPAGMSKTIPVKVTLDAFTHVIGASGGGLVGDLSLDLGTCSGFSGPGSCAIAVTWSPTAAGG